MSSLATLLTTWQKNHGRHDLPWQGTHDPYAIWLSEIMLQQTQVITVIPYYMRFMRHFPTIHSLAQASLDTVLSLWSGLGYYSRARHLHQAARIIVQDYQGQFPGTRELLQQLPGIGRSTAAAISVFAYGQREAILDGNVKRILARYFGITGYLNDRNTQKELWQRAEALLPQQDTEGHIRVYTQSLMDLGATVCTRQKPCCTVCPLQQDCIAFRTDQIQQLPAVKPCKLLPEKEAIFLMLMQHHAVLLEKRPADGIWGELWSFPEIQLNTDVEDYCKQQFGITTQLLIKPPPLDHLFTHFKLRIHPRILSVISGSATYPSPHIWTEPSAALALAIPAPVRKLLEQNFLCGPPIHINKQLKRNDG